MPSALTPALALDYLRELSADIEAGVVLGADGALLIINDGPDAPPEVQVRPKDAFDCQYDETAGYYTIRARRSAADSVIAPAPRLLLRIAPAMPATLAAAPRAGIAAAAPASARCRPRSTPRSI